MAKKYSMPFSNYKSMFGNKSSVDIIKFLSNQKIGKIELVTKPWKLPTQTKNSVTKFIFDLEKNSYVKLVDGEEEFNKREPIGTLIGDFIEMSKSNSNDYSSVIFYRRKSVPGTSTTFSNESITRNIMTPTRKKIVENYIKGLIRKEKRLNESLNENNQKYYISYYATVGEHGEAGTFSDFKAALRSAIQKSKDTEFMDGLEYLGVETTWETDLDFAVIFVTENYLKVLKSNMFKNPENYKTFIDVAKKCLATGKPAMGKYI